MCTTLRHQVHDFRSYPREDGKFDRQISGSALMLLISAKVVFNQRERVVLVPLRENAFASFEKY